MPVSARYVLTADDLIESRRIAIRMTSYLSLSRVAACFGITLPITIFCWFWGWHHFPGWFHPVVEGSAFVSMVMLVALLIGEWMLRLKFPRLPDAGEEIVWDFSEDGIIETAPNSQTRWNWKFFQRVTVTRAGIIFCPNFMIFHFLPARAFDTPEEMETVAGMASRFIPDFKRLR